MKTDIGKVVFLDTAGNFLNKVDAGALPDMITFTPDGKYVLVANEGEPNDTYTVDPEGSVTMIDLQAGVGNVVSLQLRFSAYNGAEASLRSQGIRIYGPGAYAARDLEPEYITVSKNSEKAWVTLQENNAIAVIDIPSKTITNLFPLGTADHKAKGFALDASDNNNEVLIANWPVKGMYLPDGIANYTAGTGTYLVTANEGDSREWGSFVEEARIGSGGYVLDPVKFPQADLLKANHNLGRLNAVKTMGDTDNDGDFDEIYVLGSRSFAIWDAFTGAKVYDNGQNFEEIILADPKYGKLFNTDNAANTKKNRSDNKGPEPEGVAIGVINDTTYAFIALERMGGVMVYDVSKPTAPVFVQYINTRDTGVYAGDNGAEGIIFLQADKNKNKKNYVITANETSGSVAVFEVKAATVTPPPPPTNSVSNINGSNLNVYPNPVRNGQLFFSQPLTGGLYDVSGKQVAGFNAANNINTSLLTPGVYILKAAGFENRKIIIQ